MITLYEVGANTFAPASSMTLREIEGLDECARQDAARDLDVDFIRNHEGRLYLVAKRGQWAEPRRIER